MESHYLQLSKTRNLFLKASGNYVKILKLPFSIADSRLNLPMLLSLEKGCFLPPPLPFHTFI